MNLFSKHGNNICFPRAKQNQPVNQNCFTPKQQHELSKGRHERSCSFCLVRHERLCVSCAQFSSLFSLSLLTLLLSLSYRLIFSWLMQMFITEKCFYIWQLFFFTAYYFNLFFNLFKKNCLQPLCFCLQFSVFLLLCLDEWISQQTRAR